MENLNQPQQSFQPPPTLKQESPKKSFIPLLVLIILVLLGGLIFLGYQNYTLLQQISNISSQLSASQKPESQLPIVSDLSPTTSPVILTDQSILSEIQSWETYTYPKLGFSIKYPSQKITYSEYPGDGEATSFWFKDSKFKKQFAPLQFLGRGKDTTPFDALIAETSSWAATGEKILADYKNIELNNAIGLQIVRRYSPGKPRTLENSFAVTGYDLYITNPEKKGAVIRIIADENGTDDFATLEKILKTFRFTE